MRETLLDTLAWVLPVVFAIAAIVMGVLAYEARHVRIVRDEVVLAPLHRALNGLKVVFVSDIHAGPWFGPERMRMLVRLIDALEPDVLILGGDYVGGRRNGAKIFYPVAADLKARLTRVAVLGNHDVWEGVDDARRGLAAAGIKLLENENVRLPVGDAVLTVAGVDDLYTGTPSVSVAARGVAETDFAILVSHNPDVFVSMLEGTEAFWDLGLGGHTHGGQFSLSSSRTTSRPAPHHRFRSGWLHEHGIPVLISNGVGTVTLPLRFQTPPEVHVLTLVAPEEQAT